MYRYSNRQPRGLDDRRNGNRGLVQNILIVILVAALVILSIQAIPAINYRNEARSLYVELIENECADALNRCSYLSRTAAADANVTVAQIRAHIYAMQTINNMAIALDGPAGRIVQESDFTQLFLDVDNFSNQMKTGVNTSVQQQELQQHLNTMLTWLQTRHR